MLNTSMIASSLFLHCLMTVNAAKTQYPRLTCSNAFKQRRHLLFWANDSEHFGSLCWQQCCWAGTINKSLGIPKQQFAFWIWLQLPILLKKINTNFQGPSPQRGSNSNPHHENTAPPLLPRASTYFVQNYKLMPFGNSINGKMEHSVARICPFNWLKFESNNMIA